MRKNSWVFTLLATLISGAQAQVAVVPVSWKEDPQIADVTYTFNACQRINRLDVIYSVSVAFTPRYDKVDQRGYQRSAFSYQALWSAVSDTAKPTQANSVQAYTEADGRSKLDYGPIFYNVSKDKPAKLSYVFRAVPVDMVTFPELTLLGHLQTGVAIRPLGK